MNYELVFSEKFRKRISKLDKKKQKIILKNIRMLRDNPSAGKPLKSSSERLRSLRIKNWEI